MTDDIETDADWIRAKAKAERQDPNYWLRRNIEEIEIHLRYGLPGIKFALWIIVLLLGLILWQVWR